jgi:hypothetical protein
MISLKVVTPVKTGAQRIFNYLKKLDSGFRRDHRKPHFQTSYEFIKELASGKYLFILQEPAGTGSALGYELAASPSQVQLLEFFSICRIQKIQMDEFLALNGLEVFLKLPDHLLNLRVSLLFVFLLLTRSGTITKTQGHGSSNDRPANRSPASDPAPERRRHFHRLGLIKIQILTEDLDHRLRSVEPALQEFVRFLF